MALYESGHKIYLNIIYGKIRQRTNSEDEKAVRRENDSGKVFYERIYNGISGLITNIYYKENDEYGNSFEITLKDREGKYNLSISENSRYCKDFLSKLPNVNLEKDVYISPFDFEPEGKRKVGLTIKQDGEKIYSYFLQKNDDNSFTQLHGFPEWEKDMSKDDLKIHFIKVSKFLREYTIKNIIPKLVEHEYDSTEQPSTEQPLTEEPPVEEVDDLPF